MGAEQMYEYSFQLKEKLTKCSDCRLMFWYDGMACMADHEGDDRYITNPEIRQPWCPLKETKLADPKLFDRFYKEYPKHQAKADAQKAFNALKISEELFETIMNKLAECKNSREWIRDNGQFIPYPATWLRQKRWEDEPVITEKPVTMTKVWDGVSRGIYEDN